MLPIPGSFSLNVRFLIRLAFELLIMSKTNRVRPISLTAIGIIVCSLATGSLCTADVTLRMNDVVLNRDGIGRVRIEAFDDDGGLGESLTGFNITVEIRDLIVPDSRLRFRDDGTAELVRENPDYVFAGVSGLPADVRSTELRNGVYTFTDFIGLTADPVSLATPRLLAEFNVELSPGAMIGPRDQFQIAIVDDPNDRNDFLLLDASSNGISSSNVERPNSVVFASAVPEPGSFAVMAAVGFVSAARILRKRRAI